MSAIKTFFAGEPWRTLREMTRPKEPMLGGVCSALGGATPLAAWMWRALFCTTTILWGAGLIAYAVLWISVPSEEA